MLAAVTLLTFWPVLRCEFIQFDDPDYVTDNDWVKRGLSWSGIVQAFWDVQTANWHPVTWLSHMLDVECFGLRPAGHHLTSLLLHTANGVLLLLVLRQLTGSLWRSAFVAALFALHPLRVESVAWVAERKDVLSAFFFLLTLWAYARYAEAQRRKGAEENSRRSFLAPLFAFSPFPPYYFLALLFFALGLMSKPTVLTLPFVLLLLDFWPLKRVRSGGPQVAGEAVPSFVMRYSSLLLEKIPFFVLALVSSVVTYATQAKAGAVTGLEQLPFGARLANAVVSYFGYLKKAFWPSDLAVFYPYVGNPGWLKVGFVAALLLGLSLIVVGVARRRPYLAVGWFWFLGMLVPVIGLVQAGVQGMADRYTYLPLIGLSVAFAWGAADVIEQARRGRGILIALLAVALAGCALASSRQLRYWQNGVALFQHALAVTPDNAFAQYNLAVALAAQGKTSAACKRFAKAVELDSGHAEALSNFGLCLVLQGDLEAGLDCYRRALAIKPDYPELRYNLGLALAARGDLKVAVEQYRAAVRLKPRFADAHTKLGLALVQLQNNGEAAIHFQIALEVRPDAQAYRNLGSALILLNDPARAAQLYREALRLRPDWPETLNLLAWLLATHGKPAIRDGPEALRLAERACELTGRTNANFLVTLAAAYAENRQFIEAVATSERSIELAVLAGKGELVEVERRRLALYQSNKPYHQE